MIEILGFDSSSGKTGWALLTVPLGTGGKIKLKEFGHFKIQPVRKKKTRPIPERLAEFGSKIEALIEEYEPTYIAFEEHHINKIKAAKTLFKFMGVALETAYRHTENKIIELTPREIRTELGVNWMGGEIAKVMIQTEVEKFFGIKVETDDESDAIAVALVAAGRVRILERRR